MQGELLQLDALFDTGLPNQFPGWASAFPFGNHPTHYLEAEDAQNDVQVE